jgi:hypothetical protein
MKREQVQNHLAEITTGIPKEHRGEVEGLIWELFHFAEDAARGRDEASAAKRALEELMSDWPQRLTASKRRVEEFEILPANANGERTDLQKHVKNQELAIEQLKADVEKAKRETQLLRDKLDEWWQAFNRAELMAENVKGLGGILDSKERSKPAQHT